MSSRLRLQIRGVVQGVGFRPFVYRLAQELGLAGWVVNGPHGVTVEVEGPRSSLERFLARLPREAPPQSAILHRDALAIAPQGETGFEIRESDLKGHGAPIAFVAPDLATCAECQAEIFDPSNRRHRYPFTNCTHCGPRFSLIEALPYDRERTSMRTFRMCPACRAEYDDPSDRRFHAQPNACPACGPQARFLSPQGDVLAQADAALRETVERLRAGEIVAVKGLGGFHLWVAAHQAEAVTRLRCRKHREAKPLALLVPSLAIAQTLCEVSSAEERLLTGPEAPIVLLRRRNPPSAGPRLFTPIPTPAAEVAPGNPYLGVMLPYTPLHHLLLHDLGFPVVATSGNRHDEPICRDDAEALERLQNIADGFLTHDRPIVRSVDDSITRIVDDRPLVLRRARGYAPSAIDLSAVLNGRSGVPLLAVGAHLKGSVAVSDGRNAFLGQHLGDLETPQACEAFRGCAADLQRLFEVRPELVAADAHPDYESSRFARDTGLPLVAVQHHEAHALSCLAENHTPPPALAVVWDGTGDGRDGTVWGGEFLRITASGFVRVARLRPFRLPGSDAAVREPRRAAFSALRESYPGVPRETLPARCATLNAFTEEEWKLLGTVVERNLNAPVTTSAGRLFDAVASILGLCQRNRFEGEAGMSVEFAAEGIPCQLAYGFDLQPWGADGGCEVDWTPTLRGVVDDRQRGVETGRIAARFQDTLASIIRAVAQRVGEPTVALSGGCFQNRRLAEGTHRALREAGFRPVWHQRVPPNDGGIALGQVVAALRKPR